MEILQRALHHLLPFARDILRLCLLLLLMMAVFVPLEKLFAVHPRQVFRKSFFLDLSYYFLNGLVPNLLLIVPTALIAWGLHFIVPGRLHTWVGGMPLWARLAAALVAGEFGFYWGHRWTHEVPFLWRFHAIHHGAEEIDWLVNSRGHPLDLVFVRLCGFVPMYALGLSSPMAGVAMDPVAMLVMLTGMAWGFFIHANVRWRFSWLERLVSTPAFHHWHHTNDEHVNRNYASMLPCMDLFFGTWYVPKEWPPRYGTDTPVAPGLAAQLVQPLSSREAAPVEERAEVQTAQAGS